MTPRAATRSSTRARAARAASGNRSGRRASGDCGSATSSAASRDRELARLLAEIGERGGAHAFEIAAERRERQIAVEHAVLADRALDLPGARHLPELRRERALGRGSISRATCMRQRRAAGDDVAARQPLPGGARQRARDRRRDARRSVRPRRRRASPDSADRRRVCVAGSRQRPSGKVNGRSSRPSRSTTTVEPSRDGHEIERPEARDVARPGDRRATPATKRARDGGERDE